MILNRCAHCSGRKAAERQVDADHWVWLCTKHAAAFDVTWEMRGAD
jgi:nitrite reductase/ring-hydroxylating ferredoxin subunit